MLSSPNVEEFGQGLSQLLANANAVATPLIIPGQRANFPGFLDAH